MSDQLMSRDNARRATALQLAIESLGGYQEAALTPHILERAEAFLGFIEPTPDGTSKELTE